MAAPSAIKLAFGDELRRVRVNLNTFSLSQLRNLVTATFPSVKGEPVLKYLDNEGDLITIKSEGELAECVSVFIAEGMKSLKFIVEEGAVGTPEANKEEEVIVQETSVVLEEVQEAVEQQAEERDTASITGDAAVVSFQEHAEPILEKMEQFSLYISESVVKAVESAKVEEWPAKVAKAVEEAKVEEWPAKVAKAVEEAKVEEWPAKVAKAVEDAKVEEWPAKVKEGAIYTGEKVKEGAIFTGEKVKEGAEKTAVILSPYIAEGSDFVLEQVKKAQEEIKKLNNAEVKAKAQETLSRVQQELQQFMKKISEDLNRMREEIKQLAITEYPATSVSPAPAPAPTEAPKEEKEQEAAPVPSPPVENKEDEWVIPQQEEVRSVSSEEEEEEETSREEEVSEWNTEYLYVREVFPEAPKELVVLLLNKHQGNIQLVLNEMMDM